MAGEFQVSGRNGAAKFTLTVHRGDGMALLAMNWKKGRPPQDFVGFAIEYKEPDGDRFFSLKNRLSFPDAQGKVSKAQLPTRLANGVREQFPLMMAMFVLSPRFCCALTGRARSCSIRKHEPVSGRDRRVTGQGTFGIRKPGLSGLDTPVDRP